MRKLNFKFVSATTFLLLALVLQGCATLGASSNTESLAIPPTMDEDLARIVPADLAHDGGSAFRPLPFSEYSMDARLTLARHANKTLDIQYYLLQDDATGRTLLRAARDAALRGVRVRILVDDLYTARSSTLLQGIAAYEHVEVRLFNPFPIGRANDLTRWGGSLLDFARLNHRMHNKLFIADSLAAIAGGRNIADEYFFRSDGGNFIDFDLLTMGEVVPQLAQAFDRYWNSRRVYTLQSIEPDDMPRERRRAEFDRLTAVDETPMAMRMMVATQRRDVLGYAPLSADIGHPPLKLLRGHIRVLADDPEKVSGSAERGDDPTTVSAQVIDAIDHAQHDVLLVSPYFVPGRAVIDCFENVRERGVTVGLVTNTMAANDEPFVSAAYAHYRKSLLHLGVQIHEVSPAILRMDSEFAQMWGSELGKGVGRLHAKAVVIDHQTTFVGSMNFDFRSSRENTEIGLLVDSPELAENVTYLIDQLRGVGTYRLRLDAARDVVQWVDTRPQGDTVFESEPEVDALTRLKVFLLSPFISEGLL